MLNTLARLARLAGQHALELQRAGQTAAVVDKGGSDFATAADLQSQEIIVSGLTQAFPDIPVVAEEDEAAAITSDRFFAVDPLDGTMIYSAGCPEWGVTIGYVEGGRPRAGVLFQPANDFLVQAERGHGCSVPGGAKLMQSASLQQTVIAADMGAIPDRRRFVREIFPELCERARYVRILGTTVGATCAMLRGQIGGYVNLKGAKIWDFAAAAVAIEEAGGVFCDALGNPLRWDTIPMSVVVAANQRIADELVAITKIWTA